MVAELGDGPMAGFWNMGYMSAGHFKCTPKSTYNVANGLSHWPHRN
jgi:hypothetical protein